MRCYEQIALLEPAQRSVLSPPRRPGSGLVTGLHHLQLTIAELQQLVREDCVTTRRRRLLALMDERLRWMELELDVLQGRYGDLEARRAALLATRNRPPNCVCDALLRPCNCVKTTPLDLP